MTSVGPTRSKRAAALAARLRGAEERLAAVLERIGEEQWVATPEPGVWSIGKDAEHVAEASTYHQWIVRLTIGEKVSSRRPALERARMTSSLSVAEATELIGQRVEEGVRFVLDLSDAQLDLPTRPPRARAETLAETIERVMIGHLDAHRDDIEAKLRGLSPD